MHKKYFKATALTLALSASIALNACEGHRPHTVLEKDGHYWQRVDVGSAIYLRGPKAQQTLNMDISKCVASVQELVRLGAIQEAFPGHKKSNAAQSELSKYETPDRIGYLYREYLEYSDFESCMFSKGWERVRYVPYEVGDRAIDVYKRTHTSYHSQLDEYDSDQDKDFEELND